MGLKRFLRSRATIREVYVSELEKMSIYIVPFFQPSSLPCCETIRERLQEGIKGSHYSYIFLLIRHEWKDRAYMLKFKLK